MHSMLKLMTAAFAALAGGEQEKPATPAPSAFIEPQDPDRPSMSSSDLKLLLETNIYSPKRVTRKVGPGPGPRPEPVREKPKPKPPMITGIIFDPEAKCYQVVVEDRNSEKLRLLSEPKFLKAGDQVLVYTIDAVAAEKVTVSVGGASKELKVGDPMPDAGFKAPENSDTASDEDPEAAATSETKTEPKGETKPETKTDSKSDRKSDTKSSSSMDEETRKKILEERMKRLGKKRPE